MSWADLFDRAPEGVSEDDVRRALAERRADDERADGERANCEQADDHQSGRKGPGGNG